MRFDRVSYITLDRTPEREQRFLDNYKEVGSPLGELTRVIGFDRETEDIPEEFGGTPGNFCCAQSHFKAMNSALDDGCESVVIFEDDCFFPSDVAERIERFTSAVPDNWEQLYFGGNHYWANRNHPRIVNNQVLKPQCCNGLWGYALRGKGLSLAADVIQQHSGSLSSEHDWAIDKLYASMHLGELIKAYAPWKWCVGHAPNVSANTGGTWPKTEWFELPQDVYEILRKSCPEEDTPTPKHDAKALPEEEVSDDVEPEECDSGDDGFQGGDGADA